MANNTITVFEHSKLHVGDRGFKKTHLDALVKFNDMHGNKYFVPGYDKISFTSYVGVIQAGDKIIEVLPKADNLPSSQDYTQAKWQSTLLYMLKHAGYLKLNETEKATQQTRRDNLLDIYLYAFLTEVHKLVHAGLIKKYNRIRSNQGALKGRLLISKQLQYNIVHKERFFSEHTVYDRNNIFNSILKRALELVKLTTTNYTIRLEASKLLLSFEDINSWKGKASDFDCLAFNRKTQPYSYAIELAKMIILNYCPDMSAGKKSIIAILFDMNKLFEKFIYRMLKREERNFEEFDLRISKQQRWSFWKDKSLQPDILVVYKTPGTNVECKIIIDTKWKIIRQYNPSDEDLRQVYAYNLQGGAKRAVLFYPSTGQTNAGLVNYEPGELLKDLIHGCELYFTELFLPDNTTIDKAFGNTFIKYLLGIPHHQTVS